MKNAVAVHVLVVHRRALPQKELDHALVPLRWHTSSGGGGGTEGSMERASSVHKYYRFTFYPGWPAPIETRRSRTQTNMFPVSLTCLSLYS